MKLFEVIKDLVIQTRYKRILKSLVLTNYKNLREYRSITLNEMPSYNYLESKKLEFGGCRVVKEDMCYKLKIVNTTKFIQLTYGK